MEHGGLDLEKRRGETAREIKVTASKPKGKEKKNLTLIEKKTGTIFLMER